MKKLYFMLLTLFVTSRSLHAISIPTHVKTGSVIIKECIKTASSLGICIFAAGHLHKHYKDFVSVLTIGQKPGDIVISYLFLGTGIQSYENMASYYAQFQKWRKKQDHSNTTLTQDKPPKTA